MPHYKIALAVLVEGQIQVEIERTHRGVTYTETHTLANAAEHRRAKGYEPRADIEADTCDYVWSFKHATVLMGSGYGQLAQRQAEERAKRLRMQVGDTFEIEGVPATYAVEFLPYNRDQLALRPTPRAGYTVKRAVSSGFGDTVLVLVKAEG